MYRYKGLNFGTNAAAEVFQHTLQTTLQGLRGVRNLADDIIIFRKTRNENDQALSSFLNRLSEHDLKLNAAKCKLLTTSRSFFGQVFSAEGTKPGPAHITDLQNAEIPKNVHEVRSFLGMANYSSCYIPDYATITEPLRALTKNNSRFIWDTAQQQAFDQFVKQLSEICHLYKYLKMKNEKIDELKVVLTHAPVMHYFDTKKEIFLTVDASPVGISALLS